MNGQLIRRRRLELGLSRRAVARQVGVSEGAVARLERGGDGGDWTWRQVRRLASALALPIGQLAEEPAPAVVDDVARVGAVLARGDRLVPTSALAHALGWELSRVNRALQGLAPELRRTGQRLQRLRGGVAIRPGESAVDTGELARLTRRETLRNGLSRAHLEMLAAVASGHLDEQPFSEADRLTYATLLNAELVVEIDGTPRLSEAVVDSLGRGDERTA